MTRFRLPYPETKAGKREWSRRYGLNAYWSGKSYYVRKQDADFWHAFVAVQLRRQRIRKRLYSHPVKITFWWNDGMDIDNHAAMGKMIVDSLRGWVLQDDSRKWFAACEHRFHDADYILVEVEEFESCANAGKE